MATTDTELKMTHPEWVDQAAFARIQFRAKPARVIFASFLYLALSVITLGFFRFWMKAFLRKIYWQETEIDGEPLEFTGTGMELFLGFLIAIGFLAVYLGLVNLFLFFIALNLLGPYPLLGFLLPTLVLSPFFFYAMYRARRYIMARTKWRGIRFGQYQGAWGYTGRALLWTLAILMTAGLALPIAQWYLEKYVTDRSHFGDIRFQMEGRWSSLMIRFLLAYAMIVIILFAVLGSLALTSEILLSPMDFINYVASGGIMDPMVLSYVAQLLLFVVLPVRMIVLWYNVGKFNLLTSAKSIGEARLEANIPFFKMLVLYLIGYLILIICLVFLAFLLNSLSILFGVFSSPELGFYGPSNDETVLNSPLILILALLVIYLIFYVVGRSIWHGVLLVPKLRLIAKNIQIYNLNSVVAAVQAERDEHTEGEGFANALDINIGLGL